MLDCYSARINGKAVVVEGCGGKEGGDDIAVGVGVKDGSGGGSVGVGVGVGGGSVDFLHSRSY